MGWGYGCRNGFPPAAETVWKEKANARKRVVATVQEYEEVSMKKSLLSAALLVLTMAVPSFAAQPPVPADGLQFSGAKKTVIFNHSTHSSVACVTCHHPVNDQENYAKCATAGCHDDLQAKKGTSSLYAVAHNRKGAKYQTCMECHQTIAAEKPDLKKELTGCAKSKCHP